MCRPSMVAYFSYFFLLLRDFSVSNPIDCDQPLWAAGELTIFVIQVVHHFYKVKLLY